MRHSILLVFDQEVLTGTILPQLLRTYLAHDGRLDYHLLVVDGSDPGTVLYRSSPELDLEDFETVDAKVPLGLPSLIGSHAGSEGARQLFVDAGGDRREIVRFDGGSGSVRRLVDGAHAPVPSFQRWQLVARHRVGSLDSLVAQARLRNLAIGVGILLLLGGAVLLILVSTRRMQDLAGQQMSFVAGVSHELRTPIAVVHAAGENLQDGLAQDGTEAREYGRLIVRESRRLLEMVEQVLAFSGTSFGQLSPPKEEVHIDAILQKALGSLHPLILGGGIEVEKRIDLGLPPVLGDAAALTAAVQNLVQNAIKYGGHERWIGLAAHVVSSGYGREIHLSISDRGEGVSPAECERIFEPFYRTTSAIMAGIRGNGLGLSIVKNIAEAHGGRVEVSSVPGKGSRFTICLKAVDGDPEAVASSQ